MPRRRLVLDTNCFRGLTDAALGALVERGVRLSVSMIALEEMLAQSHREGSFGRLRARVRKLSPFVSPQQPLMPVGAPLYHALGVHFGPDRDAVYAAHNRELPLKWKLLSQDADDEKVTRWAESLNQSIDNNASAVRDAAEGVRRASKGPKVAPQATMPVSELRESTFSYLSKEGAIGGGVKERLNAYGSCLAQMIHGASGATPATNDSEDIQLLQHLADDVILLTDDYRLIERVDRTGTFQAPYVRTPWEVLSCAIPHGPPWGASARRARGAHVMRDRAMLATMQKEVSARLAQARST